MAQQGSWPSIRKSGLLSTSSLLDRFGVSGDERARIESRRRPENIALEAKGLECAIVRDQKPMDDRGLERCLPPELKPEDWYKLLNGRVFFWLTRDRLLRLLNAVAYANSAHDVLELDSQSLVQAYHDKIWLCPINSGCTKPYPHPRDLHTFRRIPDYQYSTWKRKRRRGERVVELCVDGGVLDIENYVIRVTRMIGGEETDVLWTR
jgi:hypothetical protein